MASVWVLQWTKDGQPGHICCMFDNEHDAKRATAFYRQVCDYDPDGTGIQMDVWATKSEFLAENADGTPFEIPRHLKAV